MKQHLFKERSEKCLPPGLRGYDCLKLYYLSLRIRPIFPRSLTLSSPPTENLLKMRKQNFKYCVHLAGLGKDLWSCSSPPVSVTKRFKSVSKCELIQQIRNIPLWNSNWSRSFSKLILGLYGPVKKSQLKVVMTWLKNSKSLSVLDISLSLPDTYPKFSEKEMKTLSQGLQRLRSLSSLKMEFNYCYVTDESLRILFSRLKDIKMLSRVDLSFSSCYLITDKGIAGISVGLNNMKSLSSLRLDFRGSHRISDSGLESFSEALKNLKALTAFSLIASSVHDVTDKGVNSICEALAGLTSLKTLALDFSRNGNLRGKCIENLPIVLTNLKSLSTLSLDFSETCYIKIDPVVTSLKDNTTLVALNLDFEDHNRSDKEMENLSMVLRNMKSLSILGLNCNSSEKLTDVGIESLSTALKELKSLTALSLQFYRVHSISDSGIEGLSSALRCLDRLSVLILGFTNHSQDKKKITDQGVKSLSAALKQIKSLTTFTVNFISCKNISKEELRKFKQDPKYRDFVNFPIL